MSRVFAIGIPAIVALGLVGWIWGPGWYLDLQTRRPVSDKQQKLVDECKEPNWTTTTRLLVQDKNTRCTDQWWATTVANQLTKTTEGQRSIRARRDRWLRDLANGENTTPRTQHRINLGLAQAGLVPLNEPTWNTIASDYTTPPSWLDPIKTGHLNLDAFQVDNPTSPQLDWLAVMAIHGSAEDQRNIAALLSDRLDFPASRLEGWKDRQERNLPVPIDNNEERRVMQQLECAMTQPCLHLWLELLSERHVPTAPSEPLPPAWRHYTRHLDGDKAKAADAGLRLWIDWVRSAPDPGFRLLSLPHGNSNGPSEALFHGANPATWLAMVHTTASHLGLPVEISTLPNGYHLMVADHIRTVDGCFTPTPNQPVTKSLIGPNALTQLVAQHDHPPSGPSKDATVAKIEQLLGNTPPPTIQLPPCATHDSSTQAPP